MIKDAAEVLKILEKATYLGHGAEGLCLISKKPKCVIKFWRSENDEDTTYFVWKDYAVWPPYVRSHVVKLLWCGQLNGQPVTVIEAVDVDADEFCAELTAGVKKALRWFCNQYGYRYDTMVDCPNVGKRSDGQKVLFDIL